MARHAAWALQPQHNGGQEWPVLGAAGLYFTASGTGSTLGVTNLSPNGTFPSVFAGLQKGPQDAGRAVGSPRLLRSLRLPVPLPARSQGPFSQTHIALPHCHIPQGTGFPGQQEEHAPAILWLREWTRVAVTVAQEPTLTCWALGSPVFAGLPAAGRCFPDRPF